MSVDWVKVAQQWAAAARSQVAADRKRLQEIIAKRQGSRTTEQSGLTSRGD
jgi:hypothetical protein